MRRGQEPPFESYRSVALRDRRLIFGKAKIVAIVKFARMEARSLSKEAT